MKKSLTDKIEQYLKLLIERSGQGQIEIQRSELAETFCCVPSQVTYVIGTRFTQQEGYITESRRGGKGFVRITRISWSTEHPPHFSDRQQMMEFLHDLMDKKLISPQEYKMLLYLIDSASSGIDAEQQSQLFRVIKIALSKYTTSGLE